MPPGAMPGAARVQAYEACARGPPTVPVARIRPRDQDGTSPRLIPARSPPSGSSPETPPRERGGGVMTLILGNVKDYFPHIVLDGPIFLG